MLKVEDVKGEEMKKTKDKKQEAQMKVEPEVVAEIKKMLTPWMTRLLTQRLWGKVGTRIKK